jgi:hypothetical protein
MDKKTYNLSARGEFDAFCDFLSDIIIDPLFFAFAVFMLFSRIQAIINYVAANPTYSFWVILEIDIRTNVGLYVGFLTAFGIWAFLRAYKYRKERSERKQLNKAIEGISIGIAGLQDAIENLPDKIAESIMSSKDEAEELK